MKAMAMLETATANQLRRLCFNTGIASTGTKPQLIENLRGSFMQTSKLEFTPNNNTNFRILSIDMGIRNFAFTKLELDKQLPFNTPPLVQEWTKFDVNQWAGYDGPVEIQEMAKLCSRLVDEVLLPTGETMPDAILIERQRGRSGGASEILEWVFRVNMMEGMLHALIWKRVSAQKNRVDIVPTSPKRMGQYWKPENTVGKKETKVQRTVLMEQWLNDMVYQKQGVRQMIRLDQSRFKLSKELAATQKKRFRWMSQVLDCESEYVKATKDKGAMKVDDLVDSLLHALAWLEWQRNKGILKMEMLSSLEDALAMSDKMVETHYRSLQFLEKMEPKRVKEPVKQRQPDSTTPRFLKKVEDADLKNIIGKVKKMGQEMRK